jgi:2-methylcitrate dehydratase PrpD
MTLLRQLVKAWRHHSARVLPEAVAQAARLHLLDALGVGLAAATLQAGAAWPRYGRTLPEGPATLLSRKSGAPAADAALVNGGLMHSLEYDDTHTGSIIHGSAVLAAAALATAEQEGSTGGAMLRAYVLGWEVLIRLGLAAPGAFQAHSFQITSVAGAPVAALIAASLAGLDEDASVNAAGIALSQASGVFEFLSNGSSVKSLHPGWAAHGGVTAAALAKAGLTGPETAIEGPHGLFRAFAGDAAASGRFAGLLEDLGTRWHLPDAAFKLLPCCHYLHPFVEAAGKAAVPPGDIESILLRGPAGAAPVICEPWAARQAPPTPHAARWSLPVVVAARLAEGRVDLDTFERPLSPATLALAARIRWEPLPADHFPERFEAELVLRTRAGAEHRVFVDDAYGNRSRPAGEADIRAKARSNAGRVLADVSRLEREVDTLEGAADLSGLTAALRNITAATPGRAA